MQWTAVIHIGSVVEWVGTCSKVVVVRSSMLWLITTDDGRVTRKRGGLLQLVRKGSP